MAFLFRIGRSKFSQFSHHYKSFPRSFLLKPNASHANARLAQNPYQAIHNNRSDFCNTVRFFAAPIQFDKARKEEKARGRFRLNEDITAEVVRVVVDDAHSIVPTHEALRRAKELNLDLVEVKPSANPPVCKILDYNRQRYERELKKKEQVKTKNETSLRVAALKEIRFSGKTEQKDIQLKAVNITRLMEEGYRVKCTAKGDSENDVLGTLSRLCDLIGDIAVVESGPTLGRNGAYLLVRHVKFGQKKGGMKKLKDLTDENSGLLVTKVTPATDEESALEINGPDISSSQFSATSNADIHSSQNSSSKRSSAEPTHVEASREVENRYGPKGQFSPTKEMDHKNLHKMDRNSAISESQFSNQGRHPRRDERFPHRTRESEGAPTTGPGFRKDASPSRESRNQQSFDPNGRSTPKTGYGQFSASTTNNNADNVQNRYASRHPVLPRSGPHTNQKPDGSRPAMGSGKRGEFGIFSR